MPSSEENIISEVAWPPPYRIRRHRLAKHVKLRASRADGLVITVPVRISLKHIPNILEEHRDWIIANLSVTQLSKTHELPTTIELAALGQIWKVNYLPSSGRIKLIVRPQLQELVLSGLLDQIKCFKYLKHWIRKIAADYLSEELIKISSTVSLPFTAVAVRDQKTLWGSCSADSSISLNYKLIFLPYALAKHVMLHELCHTQHHNHSKRFWQLVAKHDANWQQHKRELRLAECYMPAWI